MGRDEILNALRTNFRSAGVMALIRIGDLLEEQNEHLQAANERLKDLTAAVDQLRIRP